MDVRVPLTPVATDGTPAPGNHDTDVRVSGPDRPGECHRNLAGGARDTGLGRLATVTSVTPNPDVDVTRSFTIRQEPSKENTAAPPQTSVLTFEAKRHLARLPAPDGNFRVINALAADLLQVGEWKTVPGDATKIESIADLIEATKTECARRQIDYGQSDTVPFDVVHRAATAAWIAAKVIRRTGGR